MNSTLVRKSLIPLRKKQYFCFFLLIFLGYFATTLYFNIYPPVKIGAYIRFKNEIKTLPSMLQSIDGVFDHIVMIHSNEKDDGSVQYARWWCQKRKECEIHEYPHAVVESHNKLYQKGLVAPENSLAAYYNFGLQFFDTEEYIVKIDADQVYLTNKLKEMSSFVRIKKTNETVFYGIKGFNTFVKGNRLAAFTSNPINGGSDQFIIKHKDIVQFNQETYWELIQLKKGLKYQELKGLFWFHFAKGIKKNKNTPSAKNKRLFSYETTDELNESDHQLLDKSTQDLFNKKIRPILHQNNSPYQSVTFE